MEKPHNDVSWTKYSKAENTPAASNVAATRTHPYRLATSLPVELIDITLSHLSTDDIIRSAPYLPARWQNVIEDSVLLRNRFREDYLSSARQDLHWSQRDWTIKFISRFDDGELYARGRKIHVDNFIFAPSSGTPRLRVIDPVKTVVHYGETDASSSQIIIELYDIRGNLVCSGALEKYGTKHLRRHIETVYGKGPKQRERKSRKASKKIMPEWLERN